MKSRYAKFGLCKLAKNRQVIGIVLDDRNAGLSPGESQRTDGNFVRRQLVPRLEGP